MPPDLQLGRPSILEKSFCKHSAASPKSSERLLARYRKPSAFEEIGTYLLIDLSVILHSEKIPKG